MKQLARRSIRIGLALAVMAGVATGTVVAEEKPAAPPGAKAARETLKSGTFSMELPLGLQADAAYKPLHLAPAEVDDLVAFLDALTGAVNDLEPPASLPK